MHVTERLREHVRPYYLRWVYFRLFPDSRPSYLDDCWRVPVYPLSPQELARRVPPGGQSPDFLFLPMTDWHSRLQRTQHLAIELAEQGHRCLLLNPHLGRQFPGVYTAREEGRFGLLGPRLAELHVRLPLEPVYHRRLLSEAEAARLAADLGPLPGHDRPVVQVVSLPNWLPLALRLREERGWPIVYDCHDLIEGFADMAPAVTEAEPLLLDASDLVLFTAQTLEDHILSRHPKVRERSLLLRNAVEQGRFRVAPASQDGAPRTVGYFGSLHHWFDVEAVRQAALRHPQWQFPLIGRVEDDRIKALSGLANVAFLGERPYAELPEHLARFDVAMIPFLRNGLTLSTNPIKLYEYFAAGVPVVSTRLPEVEQFGDLVYLADSPAEFASEVGRAAQEQGTALRDRRVRVAEVETWEERARRLLQAVRSLSGVGRHA